MSSFYPDRSVVFDATPRSIELSSRVGMMLWSDMLAAINKEQCDDDPGDRKLGPSW